MSPPRRRRPWGFTLIEIVVVLTVVALLAGFAVPFISGMMREAAMREPMEALQDLAKAARLRAIEEARPYEIVFDESGFYARVLRLHDDPDATEDEGEGMAAALAAESEAEATGLALGEQPATPGPGAEAAQENANANANADTDAEPTPPPPLPVYEYTSEIASSLLFWGRSQWIEPARAQATDGENARDRWVFQPSGLCSPVRVRFSRGEAWLEAAFNPLTADAQDQRYYFPE